MARPIAHDSDIDSCGLTYTELMELWLGPRHGASVFDTPEQLREAWASGRAVVMRLWGSHGRRPAGFYEFEWEGSRPPYDRERSTLWRADVLAVEERSELELEWRVAFDAAKGKSARERREHFEFHDIPPELIERWKAKRRRRNCSETSGARKSPRRGKQRRGQGGGNA